MADLTRNFKSNPTERLGIDHDQFKENLNILAFSNPSEYFKLKRTYMDYLVTNIIKHLHGLVYHALVEGKEVDEKGDIQAEYITKYAGEEAEKFAPRLPQERADKIAMDICATIRDAFSEDVVDKIFT